jgi:(1->4)-alpha-D-glucan 1-alpha-D-glucosylmutase
MGQILDIVPNHMGVGGDDNRWWLDVLENGESSRYASYFDIDWHPVDPALHNKVLVPFLGDQYGKVLEQGELKLVFVPGNGSFGVRYYRHLFPLDPRTYPVVLDIAHGYLAQGDDANRPCAKALAAVSSYCRSLPRRTTLSTTHRRRRRRRGAACKRALAALCRTNPEIAECVERAVVGFDGIPGEAGSFDPLHRLLEAQGYRLAYWQVASDEINYRRFFDINELAGLRMDNGEVFDTTHRLIARLIAGGYINGVRVDHPDGLPDPYDYYCRLQRLTAAGATRRDAACYVLAEKILANYEQLPADWPVAGTTGYDFAQLVNGLFVFPASMQQLERLYARHIGRPTNLDDVLYESKKLVIRSVLTSDLSVLANLARGVARGDRYTRDFTYLRLRDALAEIVACFPVYRTYITERGISDQDCRYVQWAMEQAKKHSPATDLGVFDFIHDLLVPAPPDRARQRLQRRRARFVQRFQQYTAPVMAKGMEDTAFYVYNRLVSLNDVGFDPRVFGISVNAFHHANRERLTNWPVAMVTTSTHDSKRSEDVRARIDVLSELPDEWRTHLGRWARVNRGRKHLVGTDRAPSRNDEYLLYQTLLGSWPLEPLDSTGLAAFAERIEAYMLKVIREAKVHTSWINPERGYEEATRHFVRALLDDPERNPFLADFLPFQRRVARFGLLNSLSQVLLKLTVPGVPDIYQGNELWTFDLVDPDNRRPVDFHHRDALLRSLERSALDSANLPTLLREMLDGLTDGRVKLYVTWKTLALRALHPQVFAEGQYVGLETRGPRADHLCAFSRRCGEAEVLVIAPRWFALLSGGIDATPARTAVWDDTRVRCPGNGKHLSYRNVFTLETLHVQQPDEGAWLSAAELFRSFPLALLTVQ